MNPSNDIVAVTRTVRYAGPLGGRSPAAVDRRLPARYTQSTTEKGRLRLP
jgi:hypothetical protein